MKYADIMKCRNQLRYRYKQIEKLNKVPHPRPLVTCRIIYSGIISYMWFYETQKNNTTAQLVIYKMSPPLSTKIIEQYFL